MNDFESQLEMMGKNFREKDQENRIAASRLKEI